MCFSKIFLFSALILGFLLPVNLAKASKRTLPLENNMEEETEYASARVLSSDLKSLQNIPIEILNPKILNFLDIKDYIILSRVDKYLYNTYHLNINVAENYRGDFQEFLKDINPAEIKLLTLKGPSVRIYTFLEKLPTKNIECLDIYITTKDKCRVNPCLSQISSQMDLFYKLKFLKIGNVENRIRISEQERMSTRKNYPEKNPIRFPGLVNLKSLTAPLNFRPDSKRQELKVLTNLTSLTLPYHFPYYKFEGLDFLNNLTKLKNLGFPNSSIDLISPALSEKLTLTNLISFDLSNSLKPGTLNPTEFFVEGKLEDVYNLNGTLSFLQRLPNLTSLNMNQKSFCFFTNQESPWLKLTNLTSLSLQKTVLRSDAVPLLESLQKLKYFDFSNVYAREEVLFPLYTRLTNLQKSLP